jgi:hypothetical protein
MPQNALINLSYGLSFAIGAAFCALPVFIAWRANAATPTPA